MVNIIEAIVSAYIRDYREDARSEMHFYETRENLAVAIVAAASSRMPNGKRHPHQRRIPRAALEEAERRLQSRSGKLASTRDFSELHALVESEIGSVYGIGELTIYDIAHRIGAFLGKEPMLVYLHAGTKAGAKLLGLYHQTLNLDQLGPEFSRLQPAEIEDCLCIYADALRKGTLGNAGENTVRVCGKHGRKSKVGCHSIR